MTHSKTEWDLKSLLVDLGFKPEKRDNEIIVSVRSDSDMEELMSLEPSSFHRNSGTFSWDLDKHGPLVAEKIAALRRRFKEPETFQHPVIDAETLASYIEKTRKLTADEMYLDCGLEKLVGVINNLPGVCTSFSCSGHLKSNGGYVLLYAVDYDTTFSILNTAAIITATAYHLPPSALEIKTQLGRLFISNDVDQTYRCPLIVINFKVLPLFRQELLDSLARNITAVSELKRFKQEK